jgi:hypothetical protein
MGVEVDYKLQTAEMKFWQKWLDSDYMISYSDNIIQLIVRNLNEVVEQQREKWYGL